MVDLGFDFDPFDFDTATFSNLVKALFIRLDDDRNAEFPDGATPVLFNPAQLAVRRSNRLPQQSVQGGENATVQYTGGDARTLTMELFFDTYEEKVPVTLLTERIEALASAGGEDGEPPLVRFLWGVFLSFDCRVQSVDTTYTVFLPTGIPVRARMNLTLTEEPPRSSAQSSDSQLGSTDGQRIRQVTEGDTLQGIASEEYGDPEAWRQIADANGIVNPRSVPSGSDLVVPPGGG
jgi:hypothetical protein